MAGSAGAGINPSLVVGGTATTGLVAVTSAFNDGTSVDSVTSGADGVATITSTGDKEKFGTTDYVISGARFGNNRLSLAIGSGSPINLTIADGTYSSAESLAAEINTKIQASGLFTGANAVTASAVTDSTTGAETLAFNAGNAESSVTFKGGLALDLVGTITQTATAQSAGFVAVGSTLLDAGTDSFEFKYNGVAYATAAFPVAAVSTTSIDAALAAAADANGNALGAGKLVSSNLGAGTLTISIDQGATNTASQNDSFTDLTYIDGGGLGNVEAKTISTTVGALAVGDVFKFNFQGVNYTSAALATADTAGANTAFDTAVDADGNTLGVGKITWANATTVGADNIGEFVTSIRKFSAANYAAANTPVIMPGTRAATGGVDLSVDNNVTLSATDASGGVVSNTFALGSSDGAVSFADYASLLETAANTAFAGTGNTFTAAYADNKISFQSNQNNVSNVALSGVSVTDAFGQGVSGTNPTAASAVGQFFTMADVAAAVNEDLGADAEATFDTSNNSWKFEVTAGNAGVASTVALSGSGLTALQIAGNLTATGSAGEASASRLSTITVDTIANANAATSSIDNAIEYVNSQRASLGAIQNRLDHTVSNLTNISTNTEAARSRIMDADYGQESAALAKAQIIQQAATAMLAQANQSSQSVLSLLQ